MLCNACNRIARSTYRDLLKADLRQVIIHTHELPPPPPPAAVASPGRVGPEEARRQLFDNFKTSGYALFAKEVDTSRGPGRSAVWSWIKLAPSFWSSLDASVAAIL